MTFSSQVIRTRLPVGASGKTVRTVRDGQQQGGQRQGTEKDNGLTHLGFRQSTSRASRPCSHVRVPTILLAKARFRYASRAANPAPGPQGSDQAFDRRYSGWPVAVNTADDQNTVTVMERVNNNHTDDQRTFRDRNVSPDIGNSYYASTPPVDPCHGQHRLFPNSEESIPGWPL